MKGGTSKTELGEVGVIDICGDKVMFLHYTETWRFTNAYLYSSVTFYGLTLVNNLQFTCYLKHTRRALKVHYVTFR